jgi:GMP synthase (glutamine-hydrolysing)
MKKFLILQLRPEDVASDDEFEAFVQKGGLTEDEVVRVRMEQESVPEVVPGEYAGIIIGGGPSNVSDAEEKKSDEQKRFEAELAPMFDTILHYDIPYLGACYGIGALAAHLGAPVSKERYGEEVGATLLKKTGEGMQDALTRDLPRTFKAFVGHKEACQELPKGAVLLLTSDTCPVQMIRVKNNVYATQFHPELDTNGILVRIEAYKYAGYFPAEDAENVAVRCRKEDVHMPEQILKNFVQRYRDTAA